jgi:hypothetical protein
MSKVSARLTAVLSVVVGVAIGVVTNLVTDSWSWTLGVVLALLVCAAAGLALAGRSPSSRTTVRQAATGGSEIAGGRIVASSAATVEETAADQGRIEKSSIRASDADVTREAKRSVIHDDDIDAS